MKTGRSAPRRQAVVAAWRCAWVLAFVLAGICSRRAWAQFAPQPVAAWATRLYASHVAVVVNADSPESASLGDYYRRARRIPERNMVRVHIPDSPRVLSAAAFATLRQEIETHLDPSIEVIALAWAAPYAVECNSITSAMTLGSQAELCQNSCKPSKPNPYFDAASSRPFSDFGLRLTMLIPTGPTGLDKAVVGRGVRSDGAWPAQGVFIGEPLAAAYRPQR